MEDRLMAIKEEMSQAARDNDAEVLKHLLRARFLPPDVKEQGMLAATEYNSIKCMKLLLQERSVSDEVKEDALIITAKKNCAECLRYLLKTTSFSAKVKEDALREASRECSIECMEILLQCGVDVNGTGRFDGISPLCEAVSGRHYDAVTFLIDKGANINWSGFTSALALASLNGDRNILEKLCKNGADLDLKIPGKQSPLMEAARHSYIDCMRILINYGANVNERDMYDKTALFDAVLRTKDLEADNASVKLLLEHGAHVNIVNDDGETPLLRAASDNQLGAVVQSLLEHGAEVNVQDQVGWTPLMYFVANSNQESTNLILNHNCDVNMYAHDGLSALGTILTKYHRWNGSISSSSVDTDIIKSLLKRNADVRLFHNNAGVYNNYILKNIDESLDRLLYAAGCRLLHGEQCCLKKNHRNDSSPGTLVELSRNFLRMNLLHPHSNLFTLVPRLPLPQMLQSELLYGESLD